MNRISSGNDTSNIDSYILYVFLQQLILYAFINKHMDITYGRYFSSVKSWNKDHCTQDEKAILDSADIQVYVEMYVG